MNSILRSGTVIFLLAVSAVGRAQTPTETDIRQAEVLMKIQTRMIMHDAMRSGEFGEEMLNVNKRMLPVQEFTDEAKALMEQFGAAYKETDKAKRESQQKAIIERIDSVTILKGAKAGATARTADTRSEKQDKNAAAPRSPADELRLNDADLFRENLEQVTPRYTMPAELTSEEAVALINDVQSLEHALKSFPKTLGDYKTRVSSAVNVQVQDNLWKRLVSKQGFKDTAIGQDWYVIAVEHLSLLGVVEDFLSTGAELVGLAIAANRLSGVRMRLIGSRVTLGDRAFVKGTLAWLRTREEQVNQNLARILVLEQRLKSEGVLPK